MSWRIEGQFWRSASRRPRSRPRGAGCRRSRPLISTAPRPHRGSSARPSAEHRLRAAQGAASTTSAREVQLSERASPAGQVEDHGVQQPPTPVPPDAQRLDAELVRRRQSCCTLIVSKQRRLTIRLAQSADRTAATADIGSGDSRRDPGRRRPSAGSAGCRAPGPVARWHHGGPRPDRVGAVTAESARRSARTLRRAEPVARPRTRAAQTSRLGERSRRQCDRLGCRIRRHRRARTCARIWPS